MVSCLIPTTKRPIQTRFRYGSGCQSLNLAIKINSQAHSPKGTPLGIATRFRLSPVHRLAISPSTACKLTVSGSFSLPSPGYFSPFPHGTSSLSVAGVYLALGDGPPSFPQGSTCPAVLGYPIQQVQSISLTGLSPSMASLSRLFSYPLNF